MSLSPRLFPLVPVILLSMLTSFQHSKSDRRNASQTPPEQAEGSWWNTHGEIHGLIEAWNHFLTGQMDSARPAAPQIEAFRVARGIPLDFSPPDDLRLVPSTLPWLEITVGPCGSTAIVFAHSFREREFLGRGLFSEDEVLETGDSGRVKTRWVMEYNLGQVAAVRGDEILVPYRAGLIPTLDTEQDSSYYEVWLAIRPDGAFRVVEKVPNVNEPVPVDCANTTEFEGSAYVRCWQYIDIRTKALRLLMFQGPCT